MSLCDFTNSSIMPWVSWRLPATSRMLSETGWLGLAGRLAPGLGLLDFLLPGAEQAAAASATQIASAPAILNGWDGRVTEVTSLGGVGTRWGIQLGIQIGIRWWC